MCARGLALGELVLWYVARRPRAGARRSGWVIGAQRELFGTPSTSGTMLTPKVFCHGVCLNSLFSTTFGITSR